MADLVAGTIGVRPAFDVMNTYSDRVSVYTASVVPLTPVTLQPAILAHEQDPADWVLGGRIHDYVDVAFGTGRPLDCNLVIRVLDHATAVTLVNLFSRIAGHLEETITENVHVACTVCGAEPGGDHDGRAHDAAAIDKAMTAAADPDLVRACNDLAEALDE